METVGYRDDDDNNKKVLMCDFSAENQCGGRAVSQPHLPAVHTESNRDHVRARLKTENKETEQCKRGREAGCVQGKIMNNQPADSLKKWMIMVL